MYRIESRLHEIALKQLRPTQMTVGFREADKKRESWAELGDKARRKAMALAAKQAASHLPGWCGKR